jgi:hypothetical protein
MVAKLDFILYQCCGTGIGTTGTLTFCLSGTRPGMQNGIKSQKNINKKTIVWEIIPFLTL